MIEERERYFYFAPVICSNILSIFSSKLETVQPFANRVADATCLNQGVSKVSCDCKFFISTTTKV